MTTGMPSSVVMVVMLHVPVSVPVPVVLGCHGWLRHGNQQATKSQGCGSSHSGDRESLFHELIGSMHLL